MTGLPAWLQELPDAAAQRALDAWAIGELGIPGLELMEHAGAGLAALVGKRAPHDPVAIVCGKGNNGGDGLVVARLLREQGREVRVLLLAPGEQLSGDARTNLERLPGAPPERFSAELLQGAAVIVDALLGTGFAGVPRGAAADAIAAINAVAGAVAGAVVIACDVPSGVDASTGEIAAVAVRADATGTFHAGKPGLWIAPGKSCAGEVTVIDIGIPAAGRPVEALTGLISGAVTDTIPRRGRDSNKFTAGSVLVCGGSPGLTGAPSLAARAAMRAGAGYVTVGAPASLAAVFESKLLEVMTAALPDSGGALTDAALQAALERAARVQSVVLGPGIGRAEPTAAFVRALAAGVAVPLVLDADGLGAFAADVSAADIRAADTSTLRELRARGAQTVLTPHAGELGRLLGLDSASVGASRLRCATTAAQQSGAIVVLKGDDTIVAEPGGRIAISRGDAPALATAGTGDVLAGIVGAYLAKGMDGFDAACAAVFVHAAAARLTATELGAEGVIASDVIAALPKVLRHAGRTEGH
ncbi:MAG: NAD(P)H-hydrate dehydratase [Solirubrobacteraceae bacterium]